MTWVTKPAPKPAKGKRAKPQGLKPRSRMKQVNRKRGGSSFPKQRDPEYRRWVRTENDCLLRGRYITARMSVHDMLERWQTPALEWFHCCWGPLDPAHVGDTQARGAPDFGVIVPLCRAAHQFYDNHRDRWPRVTGYDERKMALAASGYALAYCEQGGIPAKETE